MQQHADVKSPVCPFFVSLANQHSILFTVKNRVGALDDALAVIRKHSLSMARIESRPSKILSEGYDFFVDFEQAPEEIKKCADELKAICSNVQLLSQYGEIAYFPRKPSDFDTLSNNVTDYGDELAPNHPGYNDQAYRARRKYLGMIAFGYKHGQPLPRIEYTKEEIETWGVVFRNLARLYPTHACAAFNRVFPVLQAHCGYNENNIPQLDDVSRFLRETTGWTLRPVAGLLSTRDFLNALAFRIFHSTQYIRHPSQPLYTPEPDVCHELLGHVPLYADPEFADFSQELGLASLGATEEQIKQIGTVYWYTIEFGLCKEGSGVRAYGAGLLSSFGELEYCLSPKPQLLPFDPFKAAVTAYDITTYQPHYFVTNSFEDATERIKAFANSLPRPFTLVYNPYTQTIEVLDTRSKLVKYANKVQSEFSVLTQAIARLP